MTQLQYIKEASHVFGYEYDIIENAKAYFKQMYDTFKITTYNDCPDTIFFVKDDVIQMRLHKNGNLFCKHDSLWSVFKREYDLNYDDIQKVIKDVVDEALKHDGVTPEIGNIFRDNLMDGTSARIRIYPNVAVNKALIHEGVTPITNVLRGFSVVVKSE